MFDETNRLPIDALVEVGNLMRADRREGLIDLGVGMYRDHVGHTSIPAVVKAAERTLLENQTTKAYVAPDGDADFAQLLQAIVLGDDFTPARDGRVVSAQAPGGTGAVRLALDCIAQAAPSATVWLGTPSWPNHAPMFAAARLRTRTFQYYDRETRTLDFGALMDAVGRATPGDVVLLHGCCHNPSGADPDFGLWGLLAAEIARRGLIPLIDMAYQGLGDGIDEDAAGVRRLLAAVPEALLAVSCSKSFSLYRERTGLLVAQASSSGAAATLRSNLQGFARLNYSNPPDHGAAIVRTILADEPLRREWRSGLERMRVRVGGVRARLATSNECPFDLSHIADQKGLFALLPLGIEAIERLRLDHGVYMARTGRINIAGLNDGNFARFIAALGQVARPSSREAAAA